MAVAVLARETVPDTLDGYAQLKKKIIDEGLLARRPSRFVVPVTNLAALGILILGMVLLAHSWWVLFLAIPAAFLFGQFGFLAHEATHNQVLRSSNKNYALSVGLFNLVLGGSRGWWAAKHNTHHAQPNRLGIDPDCEGGPIAIAAIQASQATGISRKVMRHQATTIWPLMALSAFQIHAQSVGFLLRRNVRNVVIESSLLVIHYTIYLGGLIALMGAGRAVVFAVVHQALLGIYLGAAFLPNHVGMVTVEADEEVDFLHRQVLTARNIRGNAFTDYLFGGLNRQIEHHLFPVMPRNRLRAAAKIVREFCSEHDISYHETGVFEAYKEVGRHLKRVTLSLGPA